MDNQQKIEKSDRDLRKLARQRVIRRAFLKSHIIAYIFVNILLVLINKIIAPMTYNWYLWSITGWGLALSIHIFAHYNRGGGLSYHLFLFIVINLFLLFIDYFTDYKFNWIWWPTGGWGIGVTVHILFYIMFKPKRNEDPKKSWLDRKIERELNKIDQPLEYEPKLKTTLKAAKYCPKCGSEIADEQFCPKCGQELW